MAKKAGLLVLVISVFAFFYFLGIFSTAGFSESCTCGTGTCTTGGGGLCAGSACSCTCRAGASIGDSCSCQINWNCCDDCNGNDWDVCAGTCCSSCSGGKVPCRSSYSCPATTTTSCPISAPTNLQNSGRTQFNVTLTWTRGTGGTGQEFWLDDNSDFSSPIYSNTNYGGSTVNITGKILRPATTYYWKVVEKGSCPRYTSAQFTTLACPETAPSGFSATVIAETNATLNWTRGTGGNYQMLRLGTNQTAVNAGCPGSYCTVKVDNLPSSQSSYVSGNVLLPGTTYYARVVNVYELVTPSANSCYKDASTSFCTPVCTGGAGCAIVNPTLPGAGEERAISPINPAIECIYSSTNPRAYQHNCANPGTCTSSCSKTNLNKTGFCQYCPHILTGIFFPRPATNAGNFTSMEGETVEVKSYLPTGELSSTLNYSATGAYTILKQDTSCTGMPNNLVVSISGGTTEISFGQVVIENYPRQVIANFTKFYVPRIPQDPRDDLANGITRTLSQQKNASAIEAIDVKIDQTLVKLSGQEPTAPIRFLYYNITMTYTDDQVPNPMVEGNREKFLESLDLYKCDHQFFIGGNTCTGNNWKNTTELPGVLLEKALTPTGGIVTGSNYTSFSGMALGGAINNNGADCVRDSDCTTGCCGSPTWEGRRYCTDCLPPDCDDGFCECTGFASPICIVEPPTTIVGGTTTTVPIGCLTDNDCTGCHFCANATIDPLTNPWGVNQCLACSTVQDGICQSSRCIGCDPDCCTDNCDWLGTNPPYYCANTTLDGTALDVGVCTACDTTGNSDNWVPDPVCAGLDNDFCNSTIECTDANTYCQCTDDECFFGICMAKRGNFCETDNDCTANTYCSRTAHICASNCFVSLAPQRITTKLGNMKIMKVVVADPIGKDATYQLKIVDSGTYASGAPFASFLDGKKTFVVNVPRNGRKEVPVQFRAAAIGKYSLLVSASSTEFSGGAQEGVNSDQCALNAASAEITVESEVSSAGQFLSAPGIGVGEIGAIVALAGVFFILIDRRK